jgi:hypothetical protein
MMLLIIDAHVALFTMNTSWFSYYRYSVTNLTLLTKFTLIFRHNNGDSRVDESRAEPYDVQEEYSDQFHKEKRIGFLFGTEFEKHEHTNHIHCQEANEKNEICL